MTRILILDIETSPNLAYVWDLWNQNIGLGQIESTTDMLCFAAKWHGERRTAFYSEHQHGREDMVAAAHALLDQADAVVHYNGTKFDIPHLNREFILAGLTPPAPYEQVDLYRAVRRRFKFASGRLQHVATELGLGGKDETGGFDLWRKCMAGDAAAWRRMERYNRRDVEVTEALYDRLLPWLPSHPNRQLYEAIDGCPTCGGDVVRWGFARTKVSTFQRWRCQACGAWFRSGRRQSAVDLRPTAP